MKKVPATLHPASPVKAENDPAADPSKVQGNVRQRAAAAPSPDASNDVFSKLKKPGNAGRRNAAPALRKPLSLTRPAASTGDAITQAKRLNGRRIASNAMLSGVSTALSFGLLASVNNIARIHPNPMIKMAGAHTPVLAGIASAYISDGIQDIFDIVSSVGKRASIACDAISPAFVMGANYAYALSSLPKFPPASSAAIATTVMITATGAAIGGGLAELAAQAWACRPTQALHDNSGSPSTLQIGIGRAITQLPAAQLNKEIAKIAVKSSPSAVPRPLLLAVPATTAIPYMFRQLVTPTSKTCHGNPSD